MPARQHFLRWIGALVALLLVVLAYRHVELGQLLTLEQLKASRDMLRASYDAAPVRLLAGFFAVYVLATALSIPGATILTLAAGAIFGFATGLVLVSFASSLGALLAFLAARFLLRDTVQHRFGRRLEPINEGMRRDGGLYLLTLRLVPLFPFWLINLLMGLTPIGAGRFYGLSQLGMLPGTAVYVNAGTQLASIGTPADILSPGLLISLALLGIFPWLAKRLATHLRLRRQAAAWTRPAHFDRNLVVIGAGAGGLVSAYIGATVKAKVTLVEADRMGGDCLNTGCVPSKALIRSASLAHQIRHAPGLGIQTGELAVDFPAVMARIQRVVADIAPHDSVARYTGMGVEVLQGHARITDPWTVKVTAADGTVRSLSTRNIIIAAGASPTIPDIPGLRDANPLTSESIWSLRELPRRLLVLGGGPIGCELAQSFARLGSSITQVEMGPRLLGREDPEVSALVESSLRADGIRLLTGHRAIRVDTVDGQRCLVTESDAGECGLPFDHLLCAVGRTARVDGYGLQDIGITLNPGGTIATNDALQTNWPHIFAVGDVAGPFQFTHVAAHQAWTATVNALFGSLRRFRVDYQAVPRATFTEPEVATVGLTEQAATQQATPFEVTRYPLDDLDRAIVDGTTEGFIKVLTVPGNDRILGVTIVGHQAADLLAEYVLAMRHGLGLKRILGTVHTYPTMAEANKLAAGRWQQAHAPEGLLRWVARFHDWRRQ